MPEGYYVVGMARKMPETKFYAFDIDEKSRLSCRELAKKMMLKKELRSVLFF